MKYKKKLIRIYESLRGKNGFLDWWPGESEFEIMIGAILTQNTSWSNAEKAVSNLKKTGLLTYHDILRISQTRLAKLIRPSGYYNQKSKKLKNFIFFMRDQYNGDIEKMKKVPLNEMRKKLLCINGVGPETADSILLYALGKKSFVIDAYTRRIFSRIGLCKGDEDYERMQLFFMSNLPASLKLYNDYHAQIVILGKEVCRKKPLCSLCPIRQFCAFKGLKISYEQPVDTMGNSGKAFKKAINYKRLKNTLH